MATKLDAKIGPAEWDNEAALLFFRAIIEGEDDVIPVELGLKVGKTKVTVVRQMRKHSEGEKLSKSCRHVGDTLRLSFTR